MDPIVFVLWQLLVIAALVFVAYREMQESREAPSVGAAVATGGRTALMFAYGAAVYMTTQVVAMSPTPVGSGVAWLVWDYAVITALFFFSAWWRARVLEFVDRLGVE